MKIYDKTSWHIDAGANKDVVFRHFEHLFSWLKSKELLSEDGIEVHEFASFSDSSLHEGLLTEKGNAFMRDVYDNLLETVSYGGDDVINYLEKHYT